VSLSLRLRRVNPALYGRIPGYSLEIGVVLPMRVSRFPGISLILHRIPLE
jgi:hypothetical protein